MTDPELQIEFKRRLRKLGIIIAGCVLSVIVGIALLIKAFLGTFPILLLIAAFVAAWASWMLLWQCPQCGSFLGRDFVAHCSSCGAKLKEKNE